jgi:hypothetical protein
MQRRLAAAAAAAAEQTTVLVVSVALTVLAAAAGVALVQDVKVARARKASSSLHINLPRLVGPLL